eukprot:83340-Prymnesium_polylepis.2
MHPPQSSSVREANFRRPIKLVECRSVSAAWVFSLQVRVHHAVHNSVVVKHVGLLSPSLAQTY